MAPGHETRAARCHASGRGFTLSTEIIQYLLHHGRRDLPSLMAIVDALDRYSLQTKRPITLPLLRPTSFFVLLVSLVAAVAGSQAFDLVYVMTKGGPANSTQMMIIYIYQQAFQYSAFGYAAAMASILVVVLLFLTGVLFLLTRGGRFDFE